MHFLPPVHSLQRSRLSQIMKDLSCGQLFSLLDHLREINNPVDSEDALNQILLNKLEYFWLFESSEFEDCLRRIDGDSSKLLLRHFVYNKRHSKHLFKSSSPYMQDGHILWQIYLKDYLALDLDEKRHLFVNLRNYLEWSKIQKSLRDDEMISKIFFPLVEELLDDRQCPLLFVSESIKLLLRLNPKHGSGVVFYSNLIIRLGKPSLACDLLHSSVRRGVVHEEVLKKFLSLAFSQQRHKILEEFSERLSTRNIPHLGADFYYYLSDILYQSNLLTASVFYIYKALAYGGQKPQYILHLCRVLIRMGELDLVRDLVQLNGLESSLVYFQVDKKILQLHYRFGSLESMQLLSDACIILPHQTNETGKIRIELQDSNLTGTEILFPDGWGPYHIQSDNGRLQVQKVDLREIQAARDNVAKDLVFGDYRLKLSTKWIQSLTPFQFSQNLSS